jgi:hypothetical protein
MKLVVGGKARPTAPIAERTTALHQVSRKDPMEGQAIVEGSFDFLFGFGIDPFTRTRRKIDKVFDRFGDISFVEFDHDSAAIRVQDGPRLFGGIAVCLPLGSHK